MRLAAVVYAPGQGNETDILLAELARTLVADGLTLAGAVQVNEPRGDRQRCDMTLMDLSSGRSVPASESRGSHASGCRLDTQALEEVVGLSLASVTPKTDLVIVNRFGKCEADGRGFRAVIEAAVELGIPVLIAVNEAYRPAWDAFAGPEAVALPHDFGAIQEWTVAATRHSSDALTCPPCEAALSACR